MDDTTSGEHAYAACPGCGAQPTRQLVQSWGDGVQRVPCAPWICATCGALAILDLATGHLQATTDAMWEEVRQKNPPLWGMIEAARAVIRPQQED